MSLRFAYNTNGFIKHRLDDALDMIAEAGYEGVALTPDICHLDPYRADILAETARIGRRLRTLGLGCVIETGAHFVIDARTKHEPTLISQTPEQRARRMDFLVRCMDMAAALEAECFTFWSGALAPDVGRDAAWAWLVDGTGEVARRALSLGLTPAVEPEPEMLVGTVGHWRALQDAVPEVKLALDLGHCVVTQDIEPDAAVRAFAADIATVHAEDMRRGDHKHLPFGEGDMDIPAILRALQDISFQGLVCVELSADAHRAHSMVRTAVTWLRAHA